ncbi:MAG: rhodanese-like domain-containing protein [Myxococcales bacterium]|nr:rhodanese-like domain-containing protein [Myxococcales bacterium]
MARKTAKQMVEEADAAVKSVSPKEAKAAAAGGALVVDLRDIRERVREGFIPGSYHAPRGMLEFWVCPESPYHKPVFAEDRDFVFFCASGWRSALAAKTAQDMGIARVSHIAGGFTAWKEAGEDVVKTEDGKEPR